MLEFQQGTPASFEKLLKKYYPRVLNFICRYGVGRESAEDLTQEVFLKVYHAAAGYRPRSKFQTWLFTIARNAALNSRRDQRRDHVSLQDGIGSEEGTMDRQVADERNKTASEILLAEERRLIVQAAIDALPENQRTAVLLKRFEDMSYEEIASVMQCSVMAVKSLLNRAKEALQDKLKHIEEAG